MSKSKENWGTYKKMLMAHRGLGHARERCQYSISVPGSGKWTEPTAHGILRSHGVPGVMLLDPRSGVSYKIRIAKEKIKKRINRQYSRGRVTS